MTDAPDWATLYRATEQELRYAVGILDLPPHGPVPVIQIEPPAWDRELLALVRDSLADGLELVLQPAIEGTTTVQLSTRAQVTLRTVREGQTFVLQAPAWDAALVGISSVVAAEFETACRGHGGYVLVLQTPAGRCAMRVAWPSGATGLGPIEPNPH